MKRYYLITIVISLLMILAFGLIFDVWGSAPLKGVLRVGFILEDDESTPYTYNFALTQEALEKFYPGRVEILSRSNVLSAEVEEPLRELVKKGCGIIFTNSEGADISVLAAEFPEVQFCQVSHAGLGRDDSPKNFHTFNGEIYQGRYVSGIAAGLKLRELIDGGELRADEALVGFVGTTPSAEVISSYTAFLLGIRSVAPEAVLRVRYTGVNTSYPLEKACAAQLIEEGCVIISQHSHTIGPAVACEEAGAARKVFHVGYNESMIDVAPTTSLISTRVNWTPFVTGAVGAVLAGQPIERYVDGNRHGNDISAGFERDWVEMLELNSLIAAEGTESQLNQAISLFRRGKLEVFRGDYLGVDPEDPTDTCDLNQGYEENRDSSCPSFHYVLEEIVVEER